MLLAKCCWGLSPGASIVAWPNGFVWRHSIPAPWGPWPRFAIASRRSGTVACGWVPNTLKDILWYFHVFPMRFLWPWFIFENWWTVWYPDRSVNKKLLSLGLGPCVECSCSNCWLSNVRAWYPTVGFRSCPPKRRDVSRCGGQIRPWFPKNLNSVPFAQMKAVKILSRSWFTV